MGVKIKKLLLTFCLFIAILFVSVTLFLGAYLKKHGVIFRAQSLVEVSDAAFVERCKKEFEERKSRARENLAKFNSSDFWAANPETFLTLSADDSLTSLIHRIDNENLPRPIEITIEPGIYNETAILPDHVVLRGVGRDSCIFKADGVDHGARENVLFLIPEGHRVAIENITIFNTIYDYPSMSILALNESNVYIKNCVLKSYGNDTLTFDPGSGGIVMDSSILGNSDCLSTYADIDLWNCHLDPTWRKHEGSRTVWLGGTCHVFLDNCTLVSTNGIIHPSIIKRKAEDNTPFGQQVSLIDCKAVRRPRQGRFFGVSGDIDGMFYRYAESDSEAGAIAHIENTAWLESEPGGKHNRKFIHDVSSGKVYTPK